MSTEAASRFIRRVIALLLLPLLLCNCGSPPAEPPHAPKPRHAHHTTPAEAGKLETVIPYPPSAYILHLSLAELTLEADGDGTSAAAADFDIVRAYSQGQQTGNVLQPVIILECALKNNPDHKFILIPFTMPKENSKFSNLEDIMVRLGALSYTMYDLRLGVVNMPPPEPLGPIGDDVASAEKLIDDRLRPYAHNPSALPNMAQARVYLQLARFFMEHQIKEPAYLAIEDARQSLALVNAADDKSDSVRNLTREIDAQETLLHKTMPFTLNF